MREIIYRGKDIDSGKWVQGGYAEILPPPQCFAGEYTEKIKYCIVIEQGFADWNMPRRYGMCEVDPETVGQYTGLKDKNGDKIFEGDLLELKWTENTLVEEWVACVKFGNPNSQYDWGFQLKWVSGCSSMNKCILLWVETELEHISCKIIGNIHDKD